MPADAEIDIGLFWARFIQPMWNVYERQSRQRYIPPFLLIPSIAPCLQSVTYDGCV